MWRAPVRLAWGVYCWLVFTALLCVAILFALLMPSLRLRRDGSRAMARLFFRLAGLPLSVHGLDRLPTTPAVVVANHSSYVDGPLLFAVLPARFGFVIKKEVVSIPLAGFLLRRLGHEFVDRHNRAESAKDARRILKAATGGGSVAFFPEGTFSTRVGLAKFHSGAFVTATRAGMPVVPVVIHGARHVLPAEKALPYWGPLSVEFLEPIEPPAVREADAVLRLKQVARQRILERLGEPDLDDGG